MSLLQTAARLRYRRPRPPFRAVGSEPDARFTFANERTFLAWNRTAIALIAAGLGIIQLLPEFALPGGRRLIGLPLIALGAFLAVASYWHWEDNERALRLQHPLPASNLPRVLAAAIALGALVAGIIAAFPSHN